MPESFSALQVINDDFSISGGRVSGNIYLWDSRY